jgi:hypothetical protein
MRTAGDARQPSREAGAAGSALVAKLREYWRLDERAPSQDSASPPPAAATPEEFKEAQTPHAAANAGSPRGRWPEATGQQLARKLAATAAAPPGSFKRVQQTVHDSPDKVEIQNIFNVEVHADGPAGAGLAGDFSEAIADILREQAIQHGIDLT